jgi:hypothetical protein
MSHVDPAFPDRLASSLLSKNVEVIGGLASWQPQGARLSLKILFGSVMSPVPFQNNTEWKSR